MKAGRNDPCPCGSGKKYKKCCLRKDQEAEQRSVYQGPPRSPADLLRPEPSQPVAVTKAPAPAKRSRPPEPPPDPHIAAINARWEEFKAQDYEGQIALFLKTLEEKELMDAEMAIEMLEQIHQQAIKQNERDRLRLLLDQLRERQPDAYAERMHWYLYWLITDALVARRFDEAAQPAREMTATAGTDIDIFNRVLDELDYYGQLSTLVEIMRLAWPEVKTSANIVPWGVTEFMIRGSEYEILHYLEHTVSPDAGDPVLVERLKYYFDELNTEYLTRYVEHVTGKSTKVWTLSDFEIQPPRKKSWDEDDEDDEAPDPGQNNLQYLSTEFLGYLHREEGLSHTKAELGRENIRRYLVERALGELEPRESMLESVLRPKQHKPKPEPSRPAHPLCPDRDTLDRYLGGLLGFLNQLHYRAVAMFEVIPAWLRFLESRQLVDAERRALTMQGLQPLQTQLLKLYEDYPTDPNLLAGIKSWHMEAENRPPDKLDG
jgi:hypothetical protein